MRRTLSKRTRFEVFKRDGFQCQYCGGAPPKVLLHVDHVVALANGGTEDESNLTTSCADCNLGKAAVPLFELPAPVETRAELLTEKEAQLIAYQQLLKERKARLQSEALKVLEVIDPTDRETTDRDWYSVQSFIEELGYYDTMRAAEIAVAQGPNPTKAKFRYFCGICWNLIRER